MKIGIDIGGSHIAIGMVDHQNKIIKKFEKDFTQEDKNNILTVIEDYIIEIVQKIDSCYDIENIGIAIPGVAKNGVILKTVNLGINNYDISTSISKKIHKPVKVRNDAKCACLAEYDNMIKEDSNLKNINMLFLTIGTGIGGGIIYNGNLLQGHNSDGYEIGHMIIKENGLPCKCGKSGCFERYGSILEYKNRIKQKLKIPPQINKNELRAIMKIHQNEIIDIDNQYILDLSIGISNLINIFEPDIVVIGGGFSYFSYILLDKLKQALLNNSLLYNPREDLDLRIAKLGNDAGIIGATM